MNLLSAPLGVGLVHQVGPGVTRHWLESMRRDGLLVGVGPDHYLLSDAAGWPTARRLALAAATPPDTVVAFGTAVWAHGGPEPKRPVGQPISLELLVPPHTWQTIGPYVRPHRTRVPSGDVQGLGGAAVTTPSRTAADLVLFGRAEQADALAWLLTRPDVTAESIREVLAGRGGVRHVRRAQRIVTLIEEGHPDPFSVVRRTTSQERRPSAVRVTS